VLKIEKQDSGKVRGSIEARTIDGRYTFIPIDTDDCGSAAANEDRALRELQSLAEDLATGLLLSPWVDFHIDFNPTLGKTYQDRAVFLASWRTLVSVVGTRPTFGRFPTKVGQLLARLYDDQLSRPIQ
jgi:hypothetical protein